MQKHYVIPQACDHCADAIPAHVLIWPAPQATHLNMRPTFACADCFLVEGEHVKTEWNRIATKRTDAYEKAALVTR